LENKLSACGANIITSPGERSTVAVNDLLTPMNIPVMDNTSTAATARAITAAR